MEEERKDNASKRAKTSAAILIATLAIFAAIVVLASNSLNWPLASDVQNFITPPKPLGPANSSLLVSATTNIPPVVCANCDLSNSSNARFPLASAQITIYAFDKQNRLYAVARNTTNADGTQLFLLRPGRFQVTILTPQLGNISTIVTTHPQNTTELDVNINQSSFTCTFFESSSSVSPGVITPWDTIYLTLQAESPIIQNSNQSVFLLFQQETTFSAVTFSGSPPQPNTTFGITAINFTQRYSAHIISEYVSPSDGTLSIQAELTNSVANITGTTNIYLLTYLLSYTTREYPMLENATYVLPFPGAFS